MKAPLSLELICSFQSERELATQVATLAEEDGGEHDAGAADSSPESPKHGGSRGGGCGHGRETGAMQVGQRQAQEIQEVHGLGGGG